jgi:hypothetical protein
MSEAPHRVVAIHQPNFFPWLGYFSKIARSDVFMFLDDAQFERSSAGTWSNRVRLLVGGNAAWITVPVRRPHGAVQRVNEIEIDTTQDWRGRLLKTVQANYARTAHFAEVFALLERICADAGERLADFNRSAVTAVWRQLGLRSPDFVCASDYHVETRSTDRLVDLVRAAGGDTYLSGDGADGYQQDERFAQSGVHLQYLRFAHPQYPQRGVTAFVPGLSCIDALCHCGFSGTAQLLRSAS